MARTLTGKTKFDSLTFSKNGLFLKYRNEHEIEILFADLEQINIKKHKLKPFMEFIGIIFPCLFVYMSIQYLPFDLMILASIVAVLLVFRSIINYKWYRLYVRLNDGNVFKKKISYSELEKIYIKVYKLKPIYASIFFSFPMLVVFLCFEYIQLSIEMSVALLPVIPTIVKLNRINRFKSFGLVIVLKDGSVFKKQIPKNLKSDTVEIINEVKRECLHHNTKALESA